MARIFSRMNATAIDDPEFGHFELGDNGAFDLPDDLSDRLIAVHHRGKPAWEDEIGRDERLHGEESARRRDPETLYNAVADIASLGKQMAGLQAGASPEAAAEVAALREQVAALNARFAAMDQDAGDQGGGEAAQPKTTRSRKSTPAGN